MQNTSAIIVDHCRFLHYTSGPAARGPRSDTRVGYAHSEPELYIKGWTAVSMVGPHIRGGTERPMYYLFWFENIANLLA